MRVILHQFSDDCHLFNQLTIIKVRAQENTFNFVILKKRDLKSGFQLWQKRPFTEKRQNPPDLDKVLRPGLQIGHFEK